MGTTPQSRRRLATVLAAVLVDLLLDISSILSLGRGPVYVLCPLCLLSSILFPCRPALYPLLVALVALVDFLEIITGSGSLSGPRCPRRSLRSPRRSRSLAVLAVVSLSSLTTDSLHWPLAVFADFPGCPLLVNHIHQLSHRPLAVLVGSQLSCVNHLHWPLAADYRCGLAGPSVSHLSEPLGERSGGGISLTERRIRSLTIGSKTVV